MNTSAACDDGLQGVKILMDAHEFFESYSQVFHMSDGSKIQLPRRNLVDPSHIAGKSLTYIQNLLSGLGVLCGEEDNKLSFTICPDDIGNLMFLAVIGNFVTSPLDADMSSTSSMPGLASVVIDVYTGAITLVAPYNMMRAYFMETLLVISVMAIARISFVKKVTRSPA